MTAAAREALPHYYLGRCAASAEDAAAALAHLDAALERAGEADLRSRIQSARGKAFHALHRFEPAAAAYRAAGDEAQAAEMERLGELAARNREFDRRRAECLAKQAEADRLRRESRDLAGTADGRLLAAQIDALLDDCRTYLEEGDPPAG